MTTHSQQVCANSQKPVCFVDVDGVLSLFGFDTSAGAPGPFHMVDGVMHCIPAAGGRHLEQLAPAFELVWATGWEEKANEYLPRLLRLSFRNLPVLTFGGRAVFGSSHWKLDAIDAYARGRACAWIDDNLDEECEAWAAGRTEPTLLVRTESATGLTNEHVTRLLGWAEEPR